jgi:hypothetical protein
MTTDSSGRRLRFHPSGTARQQDAWVRQIERQVRREAADLSRRAARLERLAAKFQASRAEGRSASASLLLEALAAEQSPGSFFIRRLAGFKSHAPEDAVRDVLRGRATAEALVTAAVDEFMQRDPLADAIGIVAQFIDGDGFDGTDLDDFELGGREIDD